MSWKCGPLPAETWGWGAVVPASTVPAKTGASSLHGIGFYFADFMGDSVKLVPDGAVLKPDEVTLYDNSIALPMTAGGNARASVSIAPREVIITDANFQLFLDPVVSGERKARGMRPRNYGTHPIGYLPCAAPFDLPLIPEAEWPARLAAQIAAKAQLSDVRNRGMYGSPIPSRDQNGKGYCWAHSSVSGCLIVRALNNQPYADLSAYAVACIIKGYRDEGGWGSESLEWIADNGVPTSQFWPQQSMSRSNDNAAMRENAKTNRVTEWMDLEPNNKKQLVTCLLLGIPVVVDMNWWSHSICAIDLVSLSPFRIRIWNSWSDQWSENGTGILEGSKASPDGQIAPRVLIAA